MNNKVLRFHYEEIVFVLMILSTDLSKYSDKDLKNFAEAIHRLDVLADSNFLKKLVVINPNIDSDLISNVLKLQNIVSELYSGEWYKVLAGDYQVINKCNVFSKQILKDLHEEYTEPIRYSEENMNVDW